MHFGCVFTEERKKGSHRCHHPETSGPDPKEAEAGCVLSPGQETTAKETPCARRLSSCAIDIQSLYVKATVP